MNKILIKCNHRQNKHLYPVTYRWRLIVLKLFAFPYLIHLARDALTTYCCWLQGALWLRIWSIVAGNKGVMWQTNLLTSFLRMATHIAEVSLAIWNFWALLNWNWAHLTLFPSKNRDYSSESDLLDHFNRYTWHASICLDRMVPQKLVLELVQCPRV